MNKNGPELIDSKSKSFALFNENIIYVSEIKKK